MNAPAMTAHTLEKLLVNAERPTASLSLVSGVGSTLEVLDIGTGQERAYRLVEPGESAPAEGRISIDSPVGMVLRGRRAGEVVTASTPRGHRRLRVLRVT